MTSSLTFSSGSATYAVGLISFSVGVPGVGDVLVEVAPLLLLLEGFVEFVEGTETDPVEGGGNLGNGGLPSEFDDFLLSSLGGWGRGG